MIRNIALRIKTVTATWLDAERPIDCNKAGWRSFQLGLFFLPTSALAAGIGFLGSLTIWKASKEPPLLTRPLARWLLLLATWMIVTTLATSSTPEIKLRLFNWLPFFWLTIAAKPYLASAQSRKRISLMILIATVPILLIGLLQATFLFAGPWRALGGLIAWELPSRFASQGSGVFPNPNFTAAWYAMCIPIAASMSLQSSNSQRFASKLFLGLLGIGILITGSRTALLAALTGIALYNLKDLWKPIIGFIAVQISLISIVIIAKKDNPLGVIADRLTGGIEAKLATMFKGAGSTASNAIATGREPYRSELFPEAIKFIKGHPLLGMASESISKNGSVTHPSLPTHSHNVMLHLSINHGLPVAILFVTIIIWILLRCNYNSLVDNDRALVVSAISAIVLHAFDIPSFDSRINMLGWLILSCCWAINETKRKWGLNQIKTKGIIQNG